MDINDFKTFLEVNRTRHFGHAADNLCITQSTVSARIRALEAQLGNKLFIRERNNLQLTSTGEKFLQYAEIITNTWRRAQQELGISAGAQESLVVGGVPSLWDIVIQRWLYQVYSCAPGVMVYAEQLSHEVLHKRIINHTLDVAFVYDAPLHDQLESRQLEVIPLLLVSAQAGMDLQRAVSDKYILVDWGPSFLSQHASFFQAMARPIMHSGTAQLALQFLLKVKGCAYLALPQVQEYLDQGVLFQVTGAPEYERTAYALTHKANDKAVLLGELLALLTAKQEE